MPLCQMRTVLVEELVTILFVNVEWKESHQNIFFLYCSHYKDARSQLLDSVTEVLATRSSILHVINVFHKLGIFAITSLEQ